MLFFVMTQRVLVDATLRRRIERWLRTGSRKEGNIIATISGASKRLRPSLTRIAPATPDKLANAPAGAPEYWIG